MNAERLKKLLLVLLSISYPALVIVGQQHVEPRYLLLLLLLLAWLRLPARSATSGWWWPLALIALALFGLFSNSSLPVKAYPLLVNLGLLLAFAYSLQQPPSMIERFARLQTPDLPIEAIGYTRRVTQVWCLFFVLNGSISAWTLLYGSDRQWALYNGVIAYLLIGLLFAIEYLVRRRFQARLNRQQSR